VPDSINNDYGITFVKTEYNKCFYDKMSLDNINSMLKCWVKLMGFNTRSNGNEGRNSLKKNVYCLKL